MHILGLLFAIISGIAIWYWRINMMRQAGSQLIDGVQRARGAVSRRRFRNKAEAATLSSIDDAATAAVVFYLCLANEKPAYKERAKDLIKASMANIIADDQLEETLIFSEWVANNVVNTVDPIRRFRNIWQTRLNEDEQAELVSIAEDVCDLGPGPNDEQKYVIGELKRALLR